MQLVATANDSLFRFNGIPRRRPRVRVDDGLGESSLSTDVRPSLAASRRTRLHLASANALEE